MSCKTWTDKVKTAAFALGDLLGSVDTYEPGLGSDYARSYAHKIAAAQVAVVAPVLAELARLAGEVERLKSGAVEPSRKVPAAAAWMREQAHAYEPEGNERIATAEELHGPTPFVDTDAPIPGTDQARVSAHYASLGAGASDPLFVELVALEAARVKDWCMFVGEQAERADDVIGFETESPDVVYRDAMMRAAMFALAAVRCLDRAHKPPR